MSRKKTEAKNEHALSVHPGVKKTVKKTLKEAVAVADALLVTLKSLTTFLLLIAFGIGARVINGLASLFLKAASSAQGLHRPDTLDVRRDSGSSTLNYLYTPPVKGVEKVGGVERPRPSPSAFRIKKQHDHQLPARMSLTESIKVWIWLTVDIAFDIPRYLLGTASHPFPSHMNYSQTNYQVTTSSVIRAAGYPLEEHTMVTSDGYELTMQRLPRKDATKVVFFMHGVLDTSLGWVCNGPIGSHAFTAHDSGADVWLGNCRANEGVGNKRREHGIASYLRYWAYSINELGLNDVEGMVRYISEVVREDACESGCQKELHIVAHSLGAASVLIHLVYSDKLESPTMKQVVLLAPAGFHSHAPFLALPFMYTVPPLMWLVNGLLGILESRAGLPAYVLYLFLFLSPSLDLPRHLTAVATTTTQVHTKQDAPSGGVQAGDRFS